MPELQYAVWKCCSVWFVGVWGQKDGAKLECIRLDPFEIDGSVSLLKAECWKCVQT